MCDLPARYFFTCAIEQECPKLTGSADCLLSIQALVFFINYLIYCDFYIAV